LTIKRSRNIISLLSESFFFGNYFYVKNIKIIEVMEQKEAKPQIIKAYSKGEIALLYGISMKSLETWLNHLEELGPRIGRFYSPRQIEIIFTQYGVPQSLL